MEREGKVFWHKVLEKGIEIDKTNINAIENLPIPQDNRNLKMFLGHAGFYKWFIKHFAKIAMPLTNLLDKETLFYLEHDYIAAFENLKDKLVSAPIMQSPKWDEPFEIMCDASDYV